VGASVDDGAFDMDADVDGVACDGEAERSQMSSSHGSKLM
jgi:hypothetical protein